MKFTTRPEISGTFGVVSSTHWLPSAVGFGILEKGGNAFDAAVATGFALQIVEPHLNGPMGEFPAIFHSARTGKTEVLCAQGPAPAGATIAHYRDQGLSLVPGSGLLATVIPGAFDGWMLMLRDHGTMRVRDVLEPAIHYAETGHPMLPRVASTIEGLQDFFRDEWPTSAEVWMPGGNVPKAGALFRNPALAATYARIVEEAKSVEGREAQIDKARWVWSQGFVADAVDAFVHTTEAMDATGERRKGVITGADMASWQASYEAPLTYDYHGWRVAKTGPWGQGPILLQCLSMLKGIDIASLDPNGADFVHVVIETLKLAFADREAFYGDPDFVDVPMAALLSDAHAAARAGMIGPEASHQQRPSRLPGYEHLADAMIARASSLSAGDVDPTAGEPTMAHLTEKRGDTVHIDTIDRWGNMVSVTPSGGWLHSSPVIPGLGFQLNSRAQMFWLEEGLNQSLAPGRRPRTTLSPSLAFQGDRPAMVFGTPGGDQQDQWQLILFLRHLHHGQNLQEAIDGPLFHSQHFNASFYPRAALPGQMMAETTFGPEVLAALRAKGHIVNEAEAWTVGRLTAASRSADGLLKAAATPRLMQAYAVGR
jgi:gamma-glutamyltranspeptidase/glutathione hydrolase